MSTICPRESWAPSLRRQRSRVELAREENAMDVSVAIEQPLSWSVSVAWQDLWASGILRVWHRRRGGTGRIA
jgi:hypothetical protein